MIDHGRAGSYAEPNSFVGREQELYELRQFARGMRAVTLSGAGGIGKTRLMLRLLAALAQDFPDGAWFVELGDLRQPELVVTAVATAIGVSEEPGVPLVDTLADALRSRRLLLALDNCEHLIGACAALCQRLLASAPGLRIVATSREALRVAAEAVWPVPPLAVPPAGLTGPEISGYDSVRLFADRAAAAAPGFALGPANSGAAAQVCRALDGLPLAIELAAAWVRVLSVEQIAARLSDRFHLLTSGDRTAPPRQRTLRAAIDWSYDLLSKPEQVLARRLSVFAGWTLEMAERVCADDELPAWQILDLLAGLAGKSLIEVEPETTLGQVRYRMLETIREYAGARLAAAGEEDAVRRRLRDYTVEVAEESMAAGMALVPAPWSARVDVFRRWDADAGNAREVLGRCLTDGDAVTGLRVCTAVSPCWIVRGALAEGCDWLDGFLAARGAGIPAAVAGPALVARAQLALASDRPRALRWAAEGLALCQEAGMAYWSAAAWNLQAEAALLAGQPAEALGPVREALDCARQGGDRWNEGYALGTLAAAEGSQGNLRAAQDLAQESLAVMRGIDQQWGVARTLLGLGDLNRLRGDTAVARQHYLAALAVLREVDAGPKIARCLASLGRLALDQGDLAQARAYLAQSLELSLAGGSRTGAARGLSGLAALALREGQPGLAVQLAGAVTAVREAAHLPPVPGSRTQRYLDAAAGLGEQEVARLWARGQAMTADEAAGLALGTAAAGVGTGAAGSGGTSAAGAGADRAGGPAGALTAREREVVALIARGASNKAIGQELFISPATAARHVANILAKLGFSSRSQVAAWAARPDAGRD
ncbi:MAG TPA: tetratricopeptide repeat protein [Streptosporangiaceae bacterium]